MDIMTGLSSLQSELIKAELITKTIYKIYGQEAQNNILKEEITNDYFFRVLTLDILDRHFGFAPVAYCIVTISDTQHIGNTDTYNIVEKCCKNCQLTLHSLIDDSQFPEVKKYLKAPYYGRIIKLSCDGKEIGKLVEFLSEQPNENAETSILEYLAKYRTVISTKRRLEELLNHFYSAFNCEKQEALDVLFADFPKPLKNIIDEETVEIDHFAFLITPGMEVDEIKEILCQNGFCDNQRRFASVVMSKELGQKLNRDEVKTEIVKASITNGTREIEIFIPQESVENVQEWVNSGIGSHVAFRTKSERSLHIILEALNENCIPIPSFMRGKPLKNRTEGATVLYCEAFSGDYHYRVEFIHLERG